MATMPTPTVGAERVHRLFVVGLALVVSLLFFALIRSLVITLLMGAVFSALAYPLCTKIATSRLSHRLRIKRSTAGMLTLLLVIVGVAVRMSRHSGPAPFWMMPP